MPDIITLPLSFDASSLSPTVQRAVNDAQNRIRDIKIRVDSRALGTISRDLTQFDRSLEASNARVLAFGASVGIIGAVGLAFRSLISSTIEVEKRLTDINVVLNASSKNFESFTSKLFDVAKKTGQSFETVATAATEFSRQGLGIPEILKRTTDALILSRLSGLSAAEAVNDLTAAINTFKREAVDSTQIINKLANVDAAFAVSSGDLAEAIKRVGSSAEDAKVGLDQLIAVVTAAQQTTARGGAVIGNAFKTIFARINQRATLDALEELNVKVRDVQGNALPTISVLQNLANRFDSLTDSQKNATTKLIGGIYQLNILRATVGDLSSGFSIYQRALDTSTQSVSEAIERNEALNNTFSALINKTQVNLKQFFAAIGKQTFEPLGKNLFGAFNTLFDSAKGGDQKSIGNTIGQGLISGVADFLKGPAIVIVGSLLYKLFANAFTSAQGAFKSVVGFNSESEKQKNVQEGINRVLQSGNGAYQKRLEAAKSVADQHKIILDILRQENALLASQKSAYAGVAASLVGRVSFPGGGNESKIQKPAFAGGYVPSYAEEARAVRAGVGGASPSSKPVELKNFNLGGGKRANVVANTSEYLVHGFGGGDGTAVFNPEMVRKVGGIANLNKLGHTQKVAARGYVPNFAQKHVTNLVDTFDLAYGNKANYGKDKEFYNEWNKYVNFLHKRFKNPQTGENYSKDSIGLALSALSPRANARANKLAAYEILKGLSNQGPILGLTDSGGRPASSNAIKGVGVTRIYGANIAKAAGILQSQDTQYGFNSLGEGAKTQSFVRNILLKKNYADAGFDKELGLKNTSPITIDTWQLAIREGYLKNPAIRQTPAFAKKIARLFDSQDYSFYRENLRDNLKAHSIVQKKYGIKISPEEFQAATWGYARRIMGDPDPLLLQDKTKLAQAKLARGRHITDDERVLIEKTLPQLVDVPSASYAPKAALLPKPKKKKVEDMNLSLFANGYVPNYARERNSDLISGLADYNKEYGIPYNPSIRASKYKESKAIGVADAYVGLQHSPGDKRTARAYSALTKEVGQQFDFITKKLGIKLLPWTQKGQPYANSKEAVADVKNNKRLYFFTGGDLPTDHPLAGDAGGGLTFNDKFRAIHDVFGHAAEGFQFGPQGEYNAFRKHSRSFSAEARKALATETLGQNSFVNFGPHLRVGGRIPKKGEAGFVPQTERPYADQKAGLLPSKYLRFNSGYVPNFAGLTKAQAREIAKIHNGGDLTQRGVSYHPKHGNLYGTDTYALSLFPELTRITPSSEITPDEVLDYYHKNQELFKHPLSAFGGWFDNESKNTYIDVSTTIRDRTAAILAARKANQKAIFHLGGEGEIATGGTGEPVPGLPSGTARLTNLFGRRRFASGYVPNFSEEFMGSGKYGMFYNSNRKLGGVPLGIKRFHQYDAHLGNEGGFNAGQEYVIADLMQHLDKFVHPLVRAPKLFGSLSRSIQRASIGKEIIGGPTATEFTKGFFNKSFDQLAEAGGVERRLRDFAYDEYHKQGLGLSDINGGNLIVSPAAVHAATELIASGKFGQFSPTKLADHLAEKGGSISVIDAGLAEISGPSRSRKFINKHYPDAGFARGYVPNYADPIGAAIKREHEAGLPLDQIYVDQVSTSRYSGPVVANSRDEPTRASLIKRVSEHPTPGKAGMVPNFAGLTKAQKEKALRDEIQAAVRQAMKERDKAEALKAFGDPTETLSDDHAKIVRESLVSDYLNTNGVGGYDQSTLKKYAKKTYKGAEFFADQQIASRRFHSDLQSAVSNEQQPKGFLGDVFGSYGIERRLTQATEPATHKDIIDRENAINGLRASRADRLQGRGFQASFLLPAIGGQIQSFAGLDPNSRSGRAASGVSSSVSGGISVASLAPGPAGLVIGGAVAVLGSLKSVTDNLTKSFEELAENITNNVNKRQEEIASITNTAQAFSSLKDLVKSGASPEAIASAQNALQSQLNSVPKRLQGKLSKAINSDDEKGVFSILNDESRVAGNQKSFSQVEALIAKNNEKGLFDNKFSNLIGGRRSSLVASQQTGASGVGNFFAGLQYDAGNFFAGGKKKSLDTDLSKAFQGLPVNFTKDEAASVRKAQGRGQNEGLDRLLKVSGIDSGSRDEFKKQILYAEGGDQQKADEFIKKQIDLILQENQAHAKNVEELKVSNFRNKRANELLENLNRQYTLIFESKRIQEQGKRDLAISGLRGVTEINRPNLDKEFQNDLEYQTGKLDVTNTTAKSIEKLRDDLVGSLPKSFPGIEKDALKGQFTNKVNDILSGNASPVTGTQDLIEFVKKNSTKTGDEKDLNDKFTDFIGKLEETKEIALQQLATLEQQKVLAERAEKENQRANVFGGDFRKLKDYDFSTIRQGFTSGAQSTFQPRQIDQGNSFSNFFYPSYNTQGADRVNRERKRSQATGSLELLQNGLLDSTDSKDLVREQVKEATKGQLLNSIDTILKGRFVPPTFRKDLLAQRADVDNIAEVQSRRLVPVTKDSSNNLSKELLGNLESARAAVRPDDNLQIIASESRDIAENTLNTYNTLRELLGMTEETQGDSTKTASKNKASGYLPDPMRSESSAIRRGVGGALPFDRPTTRYVRGKGNVTVNTGEEIDQNYLGSGLGAVLTRDMQKNLSRGYVPNFADAKDYFDLTPKNKKALFEHGESLVVNDDLSRIAEAYKNGGTEAMKAVIDEINGVKKPDLLASHARGYVPNFALFPSPLLGKDYAKELASKDAYIFSDLIEDFAPDVLKLKSGGHGGRFGQGRGQVRFVDSAGVPHLPKGANLLAFGGTQDVKVKSSNSKLLPTVIKEKFANDKFLEAKDNPLISESVDLKDILKKHKIKPSDKNAVAKLRKALSAELGEGAFLKPKDGAQSQGIFDAHANEKDLTKVLNERKNYFAQRKIGVISNEFGPIESRVHSLVDAKGIARVVPYATAQKTTGAVEDDIAHRVLNPEIAAQEELARRSTQIYADKYKSVRGGTFGHDIIEEYRDSALKLNPNSYQKSRGGLFGFDFSSGGLKRHDPHYYRVAEANATSLTGGSGHAEHPEIAKAIYKGLRGQLPEGVSTGKNFLQNLLYRPIAHVKPVDDIFDSVADKLTNIRGLDENRYGHTVEELRKVGQDAGFHSLKTGDLRQVIKTLDYHGEAAGQAHFSEILEKAAANGNRVGGFRRPNFSEAGFVFNPFGGFGRKPAPVAPNYLGGIVSGNVGFQAPLGTPGTPGGPPASLFQKLGSSVSNVFGSKALGEAGKLGKTFVLQAAAQQVVDAAIEKFIPKGGQNLEGVDQESARSVAKILGGGLTSLIGTKGFRGRALGGAVVGAATHYGAEKLTNYVGSKYGDTAGELTGGITDAAANYATNLTLTKNPVLATIFTGAQSAFGIGKTVYDLYQINKTQKELGKSFDPAEFNKLHNEHRLQKAEKAAELKKLGNSTKSTTPETPFDAAFSYTKNLDEKLAKDYKAGKINTASLRAEYTRIGNAGRSSEDNENETIPGAAAHYSQYSSARLASLTAFENEQEAHRKGFRSAADLKSFGEGGDVFSGNSHVSDKSSEYVAPPSVAASDLMTGYTIPKSVAGSETRYFDESKNSSVLEKPIDRDDAGKSSIGVDRNGNPIYARGFIPNFASTLLGDYYNSLNPVVVDPKKAKQAQIEKELNDKYAAEVGTSIYGAFNPSAFGNGLHAGGLRSSGGLNRGSYGRTKAGRSKARIAFDSIKDPGVALQNLIISGAIGSEVGGQNLQESIAREREALGARGYYASGLVQVGYSPRIGGLGVYNRVDEPFGLDQGIDRVLRQGGSPIKSGAVPNFAESIEQLNGAIAKLQDSFGNKGSSSNIDVSHNHNVQLSLAGEIRSSHDGIAAAANEESAKMVVALQSRIREMEIAHSKKDKGFILRPQNA